MSTKTCWTWQSFTSQLERIDQEKADDLRSSAVCKEGREEVVRAGLCAVSTGCWR